ncbi:nitronate monooxygenase [Cobetia sp. LC6]|uniref:NAD(P)H-dependent flavin oxidoreductase n=1 Tax=Cobetia sp. LC6 TaxID=3050947 RepID=UPI0025576D71|nr:nitronate monooxygenase [Cobetia sp. LC6]MDL2192677.1 nitronate monooxygenase [Cobetia sp. LC6]
MQEQAGILERLGLQWPIIQAPMAGVSTPHLAAEVSKAGGLGSIGVGATNADGARRMITELRALTDRPFNVNVFVHSAPTHGSARESAWRKWLAPRFQDFEATPPDRLDTLYTSFADDPDMQAMLLETRPPVISFHFGLPSRDIIRALKESGIWLMATATNLEEAHAIEQAGLDAIVAQGFEAGGHRGMFDPKAADNQLSTAALTRQLVDATHLPIIAAGGIMTGEAIAATLANGAVAAQLGTAFIACPESSADAAYRDALAGPAAHDTRMTSIVSGRPARILANRFISLMEDPSCPIPPDYALAYAAGKALNAAARSQGVTGFGAQWAGQGAPLSRAMPAGELMAILGQEYRMACQAISLQG